MKYFYYFAYGSNLLTSRIRVQNKSAERVGVGRLQNYCLDFADSEADQKYFSPTWNGCPATIIEKENSVVYGAVWKINILDLDFLDKQEGVECNIYKVLELNVYVDELKDDVICRLYQLVHNPSAILEPDKRPFTRQPSKTYLTVILNGAEETGLPEDYILFLKKFKHNGNLAFNTELVKNLCLKDVL